MPRRLIRHAARTAGRTAVIAGTAGVLSGRAMERREPSVRHKHYASRVVAADRRVPNSETYDLVGRLHELADLKAMGALTEKEFAAAKSKLLNG